MDTRFDPSALKGRSGWATVTVLALLLALLVGAQLRFAGAASAAFTPGGGGSAAAEQNQAPQQPVRAPRLDADPAPRPVAALPSPAAAPASPATASPAPAAAAPLTVQPAAAKAPAANLCSGPGWEQRRGQAALASLRPGATDGGFRVVFKPAKKGYLGLTFLKKNRIEVYVRSCATESADKLRYVLAHELGHAYDTARMDASSRASWSKSRGLKSSWYGCSGCRDFATPAGDFAEVFGQWARGASSNKSEIGGDASRAELDRLAGQFFGA